MKTRCSHKRTRSKNEFTTLEVRQARLEACHGCEEMQVSYARFVCKCPSMNNIFEGCTLSIQGAVKEKDAVCQLEKWKE